MKTTLLKYITTLGVTSLLSLTHADTLYWNSPADNSDWDGSSNLWNTASDGTGSSASWTSGDDAVLTASSDSSSRLDVDGTQVVNSITFNKDYQIRAGASPLLELGAGGISGTGDGQIRVQTTLTASQSWTSADLDVYSNEFNINGHTLTHDTGNQNFMQIGAYWAGTGTIELLSGSIRFWDTENTFSGLYDVSASELTFDRGDADYLADTADVTLRSGGIFDYDPTDGETFDVLRVFSGADIQSASTLNVTELWVDGVQQAAGTYDDTNSFISGGSVVVAVPEPSTLALVALSLGAVVLFRRKR